MSQAVYPALPGIAFGVSRTPMWKTAVRATPSGREFRSQQMTSPRYRYSLTYEFLRSAAAWQELQTLVGFFNLRAGAFDTFLFNDPDDNTATNQSFGIGDGVTTQWQLLRALGGNAEPVYDILYGNIYTAGYLGTAHANHLIYTQQFANAAWSKFNCTATDNSVTAPDGTTTAATISRTASGNHFIAQTAGITWNANGTFNYSIWLKLGTLTGTMTLRIRDGADVEIGTATATPTTGGWSRWDITATFGASPAANVKVYVDPNNDAGSAGDTFFMWGAQLEDAVTTPGGYIVNTSAAYGSSVGSTGIVSFTRAPASGAALTWSGPYYWRCRFLNDEMTVEKFMAQLWDAKKVELITVKP